MDKKSSWVRLVIVFLFLLCASSVNAATPNVYIQQQMVSNSSTDGDVLGNAVAVSGNIALVSANNQTVGGHAYQGAVYVFTYSNGKWTQTAILKANNGAAGDYFGTSVSLSGGTALIGAPLHGGAGAAYVFTNSGGTWTQVAELTASDGASSDEFGFSVSLDGSTAVIGALGHNGLQGSAYVYTEPGGGWASTSTFTAELTASDGAALDEFGFSVSVSGDTVAVGSPEHQVGANVQQGVAYIFTMPAGGWATTSTFDAELSASDGGARDQFGYSVATTGSTMLVGAPDHAVLGVSTGAAYIYTEPKSGWATSSNETVQYRPVDGVASGLYGNAVALIDGKALIGSKWGTAGGNAQQGAAYLYVEPTDGWSGAATNLTEITAEDAAAHAAFGYSVALDDSTLFVGAPHYIDSTQSVPGEAYAFNAADIGLEISDAGRVDQGGEYTLTTIVSDEETTASPVISLSIAIPTGTKLVSVSSNIGTCVQKTSAEVCDIGSLPGSGKVQVDVTLKATAAVGSKLTDTATVVGSAPDLTLSDDVLVVAPSNNSGSGSSGTGSNTASGGGGGGAFGVFLLVALLGIRIVRWKHC